MNGLKAMMADNYNKLYRIEKVQQKKGEKLSAINHENRKVLCLNPRNEDRAVAR